jgi:hypothetical protein
MEWGHQNVQLSFYFFLSFSNLNSYPRRAGGNCGQILSGYRKHLSKGCGQVPWTQASRDFFVPFDYNINRVHRGLVHTPSVSTGSFSFGSGK